MGIILGCKIVLKTNIMIISWIVIQPEKSHAIFGRLHSLTTQNWKVWAKHMEFSVGQVLLCEKLEHKGKAWRRNGKCSVSYKRKETELVILCLTVSLGMWGYEGSHPCTLSLSHQCASSPCLSPYGPLSLLSGSCINRMIETLLLKKRHSKKKGCSSTRGTMRRKMRQKS